MRNTVMLADLCEGRDNNLNLLRMIAATSVLVSHAWPIALGPGAAEPLSGLLGWSLGGVAVLVFFAISGFLITRSFERQPTARWLLARLLRLGPALLVVLVLTVLLLGPLVTSWPLRAYFTNGFIVTYVPRNLFLWNQQPNLPGVFEDNPFPKAINGPLWTLYYEVTCYAGVLFLGLLGALARRAWMATALALFLVGYAWVLGHPVDAVPVKVGWIFRLGLPFAVGAAFHVWRDRIPMHPLVLLGLCAAAAAAHGTAVFEPVFVVALVYGVFAFGFRYGRPLHVYNRLGDYSYGMYIYAFPTQQLMVHWFGPMTPARNVALAFPVALAAAILSWVLIERPALAMVRWSPEQFGRAAASLWMAPRRLRATRVRPPTPS